MSDDEQIEEYLANLDLYGFPDTAALRYKHDAVAELTIGNLRRLWDEVKRLRAENARLWQDHPERLLQEAEAADESEYADSLQEGNEFGGLHDAKH